MPKPFRQIRSAYPCVLLLLPGMLVGQPQITSDENYYDPDARQMVFVGDTVLLYDDVRLQAEEIRYDRNTETATATGNVRVTHEGFRLVAERLVYDFRRRHFDAENFRLGSPPVFAEGRRISGTIDEIMLEEAAIFPGEPFPHSPHITAETVRVVDGERFELGGPHFLPGTGRGVRRGFALPLPDFSSPAGDPGIRFRGEIGFRNNLGAYFQTDTLLPVTDGLRAGGAFDAYSERGVLAGPSLQWFAETPDHTRTTTIDSGYIQDGGGRGTGRLGGPIGRDRAFLSLRHLQRYRGELALTAKVDWLGDSEVLRDFRDPWFRADQQPDNFVEASHLWSDTLLSFFIRFDPNAFHSTLERLPEVRVDHLGTEIPGTGIRQQFSLSWARMRETIREPLPEMEIFRHDVDRFDAWYAVRRPIALARWASLTPVAGARATRWANATGIEDAYTREMAMLGADLEIHAHAAWEVRSRSWQIDGLRHLVKPVAQYRWLPGGRGDPGRVFALDRASAAPYPARLDFASMRDIDQLDDRHLLRFGVENLLQTRADDYGARTLLEANLHQELYFSRSGPTAGAGDRDWYATYAHVAIHPAAWLEIEWEQKMITESLRRDADRVRVTIIDGDVWRASLFSEFLKNSYEQYGASGSLRLTETIQVLGEIRFDARISRLTEQRYALRHQINRHWEVEFQASAIRGSTREDDLRISVGLRFLEF